MRARAAPAGTRCGGLLRPPLRSGTVTVLRRGGACRRSISPRFVQALAAIFAAGPSQARSPRPTSFGGAAADPLRHRGCRAAVYQGLLVKRFRDYAAARAFGVRCAGQTCDLSRRRRRAVPPLGVVMRLGASPLRRGTPLAARRPFGPGAGARRASTVDVVPPAAVVYCNRRLSECSGQVVEPAKEPAPARPQQDWFT
jgi:hypothetical protein